MSSSVRENEYTTYLEHASIASAKPADALDMVNNAARYVAHRFRSWAISTP